MYPNWVHPFLEEMRVDGNVSRSARAAGVCSSAAYALRKANSDFATAWADAYEDAGDRLLAEARRRAVDGIEEPVVYQGQLTPVFEYDADGRLVLEQQGVDKDGAPVMRPRQARRADGTLQWLTLNKRSDPILMMLLKGHKKVMFADRTELTGADGAPVEIDATTRRARIAAIMARAEERRAFGDLA